MGKFEYKAIFVNAGGGLSERLTSQEVDSLNEWFTNGWEYVETVRQTYAGGGGSNYAKVAPTVIIIKKETGVVL